MLILLSYQEMVGIHQHDDPNDDGASCVEGRQEADKAWVDGLCPVQEHPDPEYQETMVEIGSDMREDTRPRLALTPFVRPGDKPKPDEINEASQSAQKTDGSDTDMSVTSEQSFSELPPEEQYSNEKEESGKDIETTDPLVSPLWGHLVSVCDKSPEEISARVD